jgi:hypothetical protein
MWREQFHGGFEYRSAPSWLAHPILTKGVLVISAILARNHLRTTPSDEEALADLTQNAEERSAVDGFYAFLAAMTAKGQKLEDLEVLRVWGKRQVDPNASPSTEEMSFEVITSQDVNMPRRLMWHSEVAFAFSGASETRQRNLWSHADVFVPFNFPYMARDRLSAQGYTCHDWDLSSIGIAANHRDTPERAVAVVRSVLEALEAQV